MFDICSSLSYADNIVTGADLEEVVFTLYVQAMNTFHHNNSRALQQCIDPAEKM